MYRHHRFYISVFLLSVFILLGAGSASAQFGLMSQQQPQQPPDLNVLQSGTGRYVFGQVSDSAKDQFMLDTLTGRLWRIAESGEVGLFLRSVPYKRSNGEYTPLPEEPMEKGEKNPVKP